uniref:DNTTIP1 dimerisation domain-containing protein n=1 Tax=Timema shepardi TaxID=629360 RepID=A0A7R9G1R8_TIMSH|nr:unnamed protein product [Timema shepardi]
MVVQRGTTSWSSPPSVDLQQQNQTVTHIKQEFDPDLNMASLLACSAEQQTIVDWRNTFNMRQVNLSNLGLRSSYRNHIPLSRFRGRCLTSPAKSLDLLRQNIQSAINKEIDAIIKKYLEKFFQPAVDNIRSNLGGNCVTEDHVRDICRQILEEAKQMYCSGSQSRGSSPYNELSDSETGSIGEYRFGRPTSKQSPLFRKRKESDTDSEASQSARRKRSKPRGVGSLLPSPTKHIRGEPLRHEGPKWDPTRILKRTLFVMGARQVPSAEKDQETIDFSDLSSHIQEITEEFNTRFKETETLKSRVQLYMNPIGATIGEQESHLQLELANKVLGFGQTRGRLYIKHPGLLKYSGDQEDKEWLSRHNLMPPSGGKAYLMVLDDIRELAETDEYRSVITRAETDEYRKRPVILSPSLPLQCSQSLAKHSPPLLRGRSVTSRALPNHLSGGIKGVDRPLAGISHREPSSALSRNLSRNKPLSTVCVCFFLVQLPTITTLPIRFTAVTRRTTLPIRFTAVTRRTTLPIGFTAITRRTTLPIRFTAVTRRTILPIRFTAVTRQTCHSPPLTYYPSSSRHHIQIQRVREHYDLP